MTAEPLVSVVTPAHDAERYLRACIESVLAQTYSTFEYLIVDNESADATLAIAREYERQDRRVRVLTPQGFVSADANANRALRAVSPEAAYVKVVHADDWLFPQCLERMVALAESHPSVGIVSAQRLEGGAVDLAGLPREIEVLPGLQAGRSALLGGPYPYLFGSPTSLLLRADLVRSRPEFYSLDNPHQSDQEACLDLLAESDLGFVHETLTYSRRHEDAESPYYVRIGAAHPCAVRLMLLYGPRYLTRAEYQRKLAVRVTEYAFFLVRRFTRLRTREFRAYHTAETRALRRRIRLRDLGRGAGRQARRSSGRLVERLVRGG